MLVFCVWTITGPHSASVHPWQIWFRVVIAEDCCITISVIILSWLLHNWGWAHIFLHGMNETCWCNTCGMIWHVSFSFSSALHSIKATKGLNCQARGNTASNLHICCTLTLTLGRIQCLFIRSIRQPWACAIPPPNYDTQYSGGREGEWRIYMLRQDNGSILQVLTHTRRREEQHNFPPFRLQGRQAMKLNYVILPMPLQLTDRVLRYGRLPF